jgi:hypothetical protein
MIHEILALSISGRRWQPWSEVALKPIKRLIGRSVNLTAAEPMCASPTRIATLHLLASGFQKPHPNPYLS